MDSNIENKLLADSDLCVIIRRSSVHDIIDTIRFEAKLIKLHGDGRMQTIKCETGQSLGQALNKLESKI
jgi:hypothetical protein